MSENTENKWRAENLGPRQAKQFNEALSAFQWETRTYTEITDHGEMSFTPMFGIGGVSNPKAQELMDSIKRVRALSPCRKQWRHCSLPKAVVRPCPAWDHPRLTVVRFVRCALGDLEHSKTGVFAK